MEKVRVRYAPSPTGYLHIGGARSALFNYLFAKKYDGDFVFRIEDTDVERNIPGAEHSQLHDLIWLGIVPDESTEEPNPKYAPYRQMEKLDIYHKYAQELIDKGYAYECYCTEEELEISREEQLANGIAAPKYDRRCLNLTEEQKAELRAKGIKPTIRLRMPDHKDIEFDDLVRGHVKFNTDDIGDWVIMKSSGIPTYNFAVVVDDHLMEITHVLRGEEHLSNTPKQIQVYDYFGWEAPRFGHMTIIINENGKKLSKRDLNILQFMSQYRDNGFLPEAIFNFLLLLGWTPEENREFFTFDEARKMFDPARLSSSPSMFDNKKLVWMNQHYIRELSDDKYLEFIKPFVKDLLANESDERILAIANMFKGEITCGKDIASLLSPIINASEVPAELEEFYNSETSKNVIKTFAKYLASINEINKDTIKECFKSVQNELGVKGKDLYMPVRLRLTGVEHGLEMYNIITILGKENTLARLA
ncbi:MAG: glutamate--tRNA ligase [Bacilli bacterium]|nr:glutamate--tRNA ligase [Bacilli bacterium]